MYTIQMVSTHFSSTPSGLLPLKWLWWWEWRQIEHCKDSRGLSSLWLPRSSLQVNRSFFPWPPPTKKYLLSHIIENFRCNTGFRQSISQVHKVCPFLNTFSSVFTYKAMYGVKKTVNHSRYFLSNINPMEKIFLI